MNRELALKVVLGLVGLIFLASVYPSVMFLQRAPDLSMMFSLYDARHFLAAGGSQSMGELIMLAPAKQPV